VLRGKFWKRAEDHLLGLHDLSSYGISKIVIKWIQDFLTARKFRVRINLSHSMWSEVTSGIPAGQCFRTYFISAVYQ